MPIRERSPYAKSTDDHTIAGYTRKDGDSTKNPEVEDMVVCFADLLKVMKREDPDLRFSTKDILERIAWTGGTRIEEAHKALARRILDHL